jgi:putative restriction endonuclease
MAESRTKWTWEERLVAFRLYFHTPFGQLHRNNPEIIDIAQVLGRTPSAISMKACNFASLDPAQAARGISGLKGVSADDRKLWAMFDDDSESIAQAAEDAYENAMDREPSIQNNKMDQPTGPTEVELTVSARRVQTFFRNAVLIAYNKRCALTGLAIPGLLNASHIIPWSIDATRRADPRNGLCLNAFHDRAFDRGFITFDKQLRTVVSTDVQSFDEDESIGARFLTNMIGKPLSRPYRFDPDEEALEFHRTSIFRG